MDVGFIGLGTMGSRMAANLIKGGHRLWAYDVAPRALARASELGTTPCGSVREASEGRDAVLLSLTTPAVVEQVIAGPEGVLSAARVPKLLIDLSTGLPDMTKRLASVAAAKGCQLLDAPVSGGPEGAAAGTLSIMAGGPGESFERALPLLRLLGTEVFRVGDVGAGNTVKLVNNAITGGTRAVIAEAMMMGVLAGLEPKTLYDVISASTGNSRAFQNMAPRVRTGNFEPGFAVRLMHKDLDLATQLGQQLGIPMPMVNLAKQTYQAARTAGLGDLDQGAVAILLERLMGVEMRDRS